METNARRNGSERAQGAGAFDSKKFGKLLQRERKGRGYKSAAALAAACGGLGVPFSIDAIRRVESGRQDMTFNQAMAVCIALYGTFSTAPLHRLAAACVPDSWGDRESEFEKRLFEGTRGALLDVLLHAEAFAEWMGDGGDDGTE